MVKIDFPLPTDGKMHRFCIVCRKEGAVQIHQDGKTLYHCDACGQTNGRAIYFDKHVVWLDDEGELWHDGGGVFVRDERGKFLFFMRTEYPLALTIPGGHLDRGEGPEQTARRELLEEAGVTADRLVLVVDADIVGDSCSAGADRHHWFGYVAQVPYQEVTIQEEGEKPVWLTLDEALQQELTMPVRWVIERYRPQLEAAT